LGLRAITTKTKAGTTTTSTCDLTPFTPLTSPPQSATNPAVGNTTLTGPAGSCLAGNIDTNQPVGRPLYPALFITDLGTNPNFDICGPTHANNATDCKDWQWAASVGNPTGGGIAPNFVSGTWKGAVRNTDTTKIPNVTTLVPDSDPKANGKIL